MTSRESRLSRLERMSPPASPVKLPHDLRDWTDEHFAALVRWCVHDQLVPIRGPRGARIMPRSPLADLPLATLKALANALEASLEGDLVRGVSLIT